MDRKISQNLVTMPGVLVVRKISQYLVTMPGVLMVTHHRLGFLPSDSELPQKQTPAAMLSLKGAASWEKTVLFWLSVK